MANPVTNIRLDPTLKARVLKRAKEEGLSLTGVAKLLFKAYAEGQLVIGVAQKETEYPPEYIEMILKESKEMDQLIKEGKLKGYTSGKEMIDDILSE